MESVDRGMVRDLMMCGLVKNQEGAIQFTEAGRKLFHELRGTRPNADMKSRDVRPATLPGGPSRPGYPRDSAGGGALK